MRSSSLDQKLLNTLAAFIGLGLWLPAVGVPVGGVVLQPLDLLSLAGLPLIVVFRARLTALNLPVCALLALSFILSVWAGGSVFILGYYSLFILPFVLTVHIIANGQGSRRLFLSAFIAGGVLSCVFFLLQITMGAEVLDFRNNTFFSLPQQYGRGFALFPEVSTFAAHAILLLGVIIVKIMAPNAGSKGIWVVVLVLILTSLLFTRSTAFLAIAPLLVGFAVFRTRAVTLNTLIMVILVVALSALVLSYFLSAFYVDRMVDDAASRSAAIRLASVLGGVSPLYTGDIFGMGLGNNDLVRGRAYEAARSFGLNIGQLSSGINSLVVSRIFEEGWPAVLQLTFSAGLLIRAALVRDLDSSEKALIVIAVGSFLVSTLVIGYRGIYTNWLWIALPMAILAKRDHREPSQIQPS